MQIKILANTGYYEENGIFPIQAIANYNNQRLLRATSWYAVNYAMTLCPWLLFELRSVHVHHANEQPFVEHVFRNKVFM